MWYTPEMASVKEALVEGRVVGMFMGNVEVDVDNDDEMMGVCADTFCKYYGLGPGDMEEVCFSPIDPVDFTDPRTVYAIDFEGDTYTMLRNEVPTRE
jgi:hypothetical protein